MEICTQTVVLAFGTQRGQCLDPDVFDERAYKTHLGHFLRARLGTYGLSSSSNNRRPSALALMMNNHLMEWEGPTMNHPQPPDSQPGRTCQPAAAAGDVWDVASSQSAGGVLRLLTDTPPARSDRRRRVSVASSCRRCRWQLQVSIPSWHGV